MVICKNCGEREVEEPFGWCGICLDDPQNLDYPENVKYLPDFDVAEVVYFIIEEGDYSHVKIGRTRRGVKFRLKDLQSGNWRKLTIWKSVENLSENEVHTMFDTQRVIKEWFEVDETLREYIDTLL